MEVMKGDTMTEALDLATATPIEVDTALAEIYGRYYVALDRLDRVRKDAEYSAKRVAKHANPSKYDQDSLAAAEARVEAAKEAVSAIYAETFPYQAEYDSRPWTRAWKVINSNGHVHRTMNCQTCFATTQFAWLPQVSGMPEAEIVELAASAACTICFPTAPVDRPTSLFTRDEQQAQAEREARAAAKIEREAKRLAKALLPDGSVLTIGEGRSYRERFETLASARGWLTDSFFWPDGHPSFPAEAVEVVAAAVAAKEGKAVEAVLAEAKKRAAKRR